MSSFAIHRDVFTRFPDYIVVALLARHLDQLTDPGRTHAILAETTTYVRSRLAGVDPKELPEIAVWRRAFRELGWSASTYQSSVEALLRRTLKGNPPPSINPAVDLANSASLRFLVPIGAHDWASVPAGLVVRPAQPGDEFLPFGDGTSESPEPNEIVYAHRNEIRTRRWVWRQSRLGLVTPHTTTVFYPIDAFRGTTEHAALEAAAWLREMLTTHLGAEVDQVIVSRDQPVVTFD